MTEALATWTVYGAAGSGSVPIEAALKLLHLPYTVIEAATWVDPAAQERVAPLNALRQVPTVILPGGEVMTESAAILIHLGDSSPGSGLAPALYDPLRPQFLRWMHYVSSAIYALHWILVDPARAGAPAGSGPAVTRALYDRIASCWAVMNEQIDAPHFLLSSELTVLDLYVATVSRFGPWRNRFYAAAPKLADAVRRVDRDPRLATFWSMRYPFEDGWEG